MKRIISLSVLALLLGSVSYAQQDPQFSMNMHNRLFPNPGVAGSNNAICATLLGREQWVGFEGKPETFLFSIHAPVRLIRGGVGLSVFMDKLGQEQSIGIKGAYAYRHTVGIGTLGIGVGIGMVNKTIVADWTAIDDFNNDPSIPNANVSDMAMDFDLGLYYKTGNLYLGLSSMHLNQGDLTGTSFDYTLQRHYYVMAGYDYHLNGNDEWILKPSVFVKSDMASAQVDINMNVMFKNQFWGGLSYRISDAIVPMIGMQTDGVGPGVLKFGFAYDITTSLMSEYVNFDNVSNTTTSTGTITGEIMVGYCFKIPSTPPVSRHKTVRFL